MTPEQKDKIDNMSYEQMLSLWRNAYVGHPMFHNDVGDYFSKVMNEKRQQISDADHVRASKNIGWEG